MLVLEGVGHVYSAGTPWAHRALAAKDLLAHVQTLA